MADADALAAEIADFVRSGTASEDRFEALARGAFALQHARLPPIRRLAAERGVAPGALASWREVPPVPVAAFQRLELTVAPARLVFRSSGTTGAARSVHFHPFPNLYRATVDAAFPAACLPDGATRRLPILRLVPRHAELPDSSLAFMAEHVVERWGDAASGGAFGAAGVDLPTADRWATDRAADGRPGFVFATAFALVAWLDALAAAGRRLALPAGTVVFETGGTKGRTREIGRGELLAAIEERLGVPPTRVVREYGMTELTSQLYTRVLHGGDPDLFVPPPWVRIRVLDPETLAESPAGEPGLVAVFDLANLGSAVHVLTQDLGIADGRGLRLLGRASGAELRGCSLTVEELAMAARQ